MFLNHSISLGFFLRRRFKIVLFPQLPVVNGTKPCVVLHFIAPNGIIYKLKYFNGVIYILDLKLNSVKLKVFGVI